MSSLNEPRDHISIAIFFTLSKNNLHTIWPNGLTTVSNSVNNRHLDKHNLMPFTDHSHYKSLNQSVSQAQMQATCDNQHDNQGTRIAVVKMRCQKVHCSAQP